MIVAYFAQIHLPPIKVFPCCSAPRTLSLFCGVKVEGRHLPKLRHKITAAVTGNNLFS
jgi:hypothetical protein